MPGFRCEKDPKTLFRRWYNEAVRTRMENPHAMALATASRKAAPSVRFVLFQGWLPEGLSFYTNYRSRKAKELDANPKATCVFYWRETGKQIRVEGKVVRLSRARSETYFAGRPRGSQLSAWVSPQSGVLHRRMDWAGHRRLERELLSAKRRFKGGPIPCPPFWGGFALDPDRIEFWKSGRYRLHYRIRYERRGLRWTVSELAP